MCGNVLVMFKTDQRSVVFRPKVYELIELVVVVVVVVVVGSRKM